MLEQLVSGVEILPNGRFPKLNSWVSRMREHPVVKSVLLSTELHVKFSESMHKKDGVPDYDIGLEE